MKSSLIFILILVSVQSLAASDLSPIIEVLSQSQVAPEVMSCDDESSLLQKCAVDLCGPPESALSLDGEENPAPTEFEKLTPELLQKLPEVIGKVIEKNKRMIAQLKSESQKKIFKNFDGYNEEEFSREAMNLVGDIVSLRVNRDTPIRDRFSPEFETTDPKYLALIHHVLPKLKALHQAQPLHPFLIPLNLLTDEERDELSVVSAGELLSRLPKDDPRIQEIKDASKLLSIPFDRERMNGDDIYERLVARTKLAEMIFSPAKICDGQCQNLLRDYIRSAQNRRIAVFEEANNDPALPQRQLAECMSSIRIPVHYRERKEQFEKRVPGLLAQFIEKGMAGSSAHSKQQFHDYVTKDLRLRFSRFGDIDPLEALKRVENELNTRPLVETNGGDLWDFLSDFSNGEEAWPLEKSSVCYITPVEDSTDHFSPGKKELGVSPMSCTYEEIGDGVFSHELGHVMSHLVKERALSSSTEKEFLRLRTCVQDSHPSQAKPSGPFAHAGDSWYTEENMADVLSSRTIQNPKLTQCALLSPSQDKGSYERLLISYTGEDDTHSTSLTRVMREKVFRGETLPLACQTLLNKDKSGLKVHACR